MGQAMPNPLQQTPVTITLREFFLPQKRRSGVVSVSVSTEQKITRELARLRMWREDGDPAELLHVTEMAHDKINEFLDVLDQEHTTQSKVSHVNTTHHVGG